MSNSAKTEPSDFLRFESPVGELARCQHEDHSIRVHGWAESNPFISVDHDDAAMFGYVVDGETELRFRNSSYRITAGQYFSVPPPCSVLGGAGLVLQHSGFSPLSIFGGSIEATGRLRYISGCTDTLLISPPRLGDPCLNALYFPGGINQTPHTHPSLRVGVVASGSGEAVLADRVESLNVGDIFIIAPWRLHAFRTAPDQPMTVIAYHPDSDFGPTDEDHPMINRTLIERCAD